MSETKYTLLQFLKGTVIAIIFSLLSVLIFAFIIKVFSLPIKSVKPIVTTLKILAVALGVLLSVRGEKGLLKGALLGVIIIFTAFILFSIIGGGFEFSLNFLWELLLGAGVGAISGIFAVNLKR